MNALLIYVHFQWWGVSSSDFCNWGNMSKGLRVPAVDVEPHMLVVSHCNTCEGSRPSSFPVEALLRPFALLFHPFPRCVAIPARTSRPSHVPIVHMSSSIADNCPDDKQAASLTRRVFRFSRPDSFRYCRRPRICSSPGLSVYPLYSTAIRFRDRIQICTPLISHRMPIPSF